MLQHRIDFTFFFFKKPFGTFSRQKETQQHNQESSWFLDTSEYRLVQSVGNQRKISNGEKTDIGSKTSSSTMFLQPQKPEAGHRPWTASKGGISTSVNRWGLAGNLLGRNHSQGSWWKSFWMTSQKRKCYQINLAGWAPSSGPKGYTRMFSNAV